MKVSVDELKNMVTEAVKKRLAEGKTRLNEGPEEIAIRMVMDDMADILVSSLAEELARATSKDQNALEPIIFKAYQQMIRFVVQGIEREMPTQIAQAPRRRVVGGVGVGAGAK